MSRVGTEYTHQAGCQASDQGSKKPCHRSAVWLGQRHRHRLVISLLIACGRCARGRTGHKSWADKTCTLASMAQNAQLYQGIDYVAGVDHPWVCPSVVLNPKPNVPMPLVLASAPCDEPRS